MYLGYKPSARPSDLLFHEQLLFNARICCSLPVYNSLSHSFWQLINSFKYLLQHRLRQRIPLAEFKSNVQN